MEEAARGAPPRLKGWILRLRWKESKPQGDCSLGYTVDGCEIHFAPPKNPWNDSPAIPRNNGFNHGFEWCRILSIHSIGHEHLRVGHHGRSLVESMRPSRWCAVRLCIKDHLGMDQNETTRNWTAGFSPCFHLITRVPFWGYPIFDPRFTCSSFPFSGVPFWCTHLSLSITLARASWRTCRGRDAGDEQMAMSLGFKPPLKQRLTQFG